jgi:type I restriction enzyme S subunit
MTHELPPGWRLASLGEVTNNHDSRRVPVRQQDRRPGPYPYYGASGIVDSVDDFLFEGLHLLIAEDGENLRSRKTAVAFLADGRFWVNNHAHVLTGKAGLADTGFLAYAIGEADISAYVTGSAQPKLSQASLSGVKLPLPDLNEQRRIAGVLSALDDKIEHNSRISNRLAHLARDLFGNSVVRWRADSRPALLGDLAAPNREPADATQPYIGLDAMPRGSTVLSEWAVEDAPNGQAIRFRRGDVLFGKLRPYFKKVGVAPIDGRCSTEILVLRPVEPHLWGLLLGYVSSDAFISYCVQVSRGTKMPRAEWRDISTFPVAIPSDEQASELASQMKLLHESAIALVHESKSLASIRSALLPKLVSGAVRVPDGYDPDEALGSVAEPAGPALP